MPSAPNVSPALEAILRKVIGFATAVMMVTTLSAIAVVKADHSKGKQVLASGKSRATNGAGEDFAAGDASGGGDQGGAGQTAAGGAAGGGPGGGGGGPAAGGGAAGGAAGAKGAGPNQARGGGGCTDQNPNIGVFCDHFLVGGTTVLSGPLAVYGDQGLKGGLAWITYYNTEVAPKEHLRQAKLIWYNDDLDTQKTLSYVQRLHDVDKVLYLGGVTSPEAISSYLQSTQFPMIGDIGLSPKSWTNRYIFPTAPSQDVRNPLRIKEAKEKFGITKFAVIEDVLPSVDTGPDQKAWKNAASMNGVQETDYVEIASTASDCSSQFSRVIQSNPDYLVLPTASGAMLACLREAKSHNIKAGAKMPDGKTVLKGWTGGSNLKVETDNCAPWCEGMISIGTIFNDPQTSNTPQMQTYRSNMAKYAPNVDITGFIAINYYHAGYVFYNLVKAAHIESSLTRENLVNAAEHFGPFDTGFGNTVQWTTKVPREPWNCGYMVQVRSGKWVFDSQKFCL